MANNIDINEWIQLDESAFRAKAEALMLLADALDKLEKNLKQRESNLKSYANSLKGLEFGKEAEQKLSKFIANFDKLSDQMKTTKKASDDLASAQSKVNNQFKAAEGSVAALEQQLKENTKAYKALGDEADQSIKDKYLNDIKEVSNRLEQQRKVINDVRKESRNFAKDTDVATNSIEALRRELSQVTRKRNKLALDSDDFKKATQKAKVLSDELKRLEKQAGDSRRNVGNYADAIKEAFAGVKGVGGGAISGIVSGGGLGAGLAGGAAALPQIAAIAGAVEVLNTIGEKFEEINKLRLDIKAISGTSGKELNTLASQVSALSATFGLETKEITDAANSLAKQFGVSFGEAANILEESLLQAGINSEVVLDLIREYPVQFQNAGIGIEDFTKIIGEAAKSGDFFADKIADSVKEITLRLSEFPKATKDALRGAFGDQFTRDIERRVKSGTEPIIDIFQDIGKAAKDAGLNTQQLATLTADLGGSPTEDVGGLVRVYDLLNDALSDNNKELSELEQKQRKTLEIQKEYNQELTDLASNFEGIGNAIQNVFLQSLTAVLGVINDIVKEFNFFFESANLQIDKYKKSIEGLNEEGIRSGITEITKTLADQENQLFANKAEIDDFKKRIQALKDEGFSPFSEGMKSLNAQLADSYQKERRLNKEIEISRGKMQALFKQLNRVKDVRQEENEELEKSTQKYSRQSKEIKKKTKLNEELLLSEEKLEKQQAKQIDKEIQLPEISTEPSELKAASRERIKIFEDEGEAILFAADQLQDGLNQIFGQIFENRNAQAQQAFDYQAMLFDQEREKVKDNEFLLNEINERQQEAEKAFLERQAKREKGQALFMASLNAVLALSRAFVTYDFASAIAAAAQVAIIAATPIPKYAKGTQYSKGGVAELAEAGSEIVVSPSGETSLITQRGFYNLEEGSKVIPNPQIDSFAAHNGLLLSDSDSASEAAILTLNYSPMFQELIKTNEELRKELAKKDFSVHTTHITEKGIFKTVSNQERSKKWLELNR